MSLQELADKQAIYEQMCRYCQAIDRTDLELLKSTFHEDARADMGVVDAPAMEFADQIIPYLEETLVMATHRITNVWIEVRGNRAFAESYMLGYAWDADQKGGPKDIPDGMRYADIWEKREAGSWKILHRKLIMDWNACWEHSGVFVEGMYAEFTRGRRGKSDPGYEFGTTG
ncbi:MAG: nuclear transport factor 2 family protein [Alphaproteobacteria bacterium]|nr:nuclear transport factor 2 family protein [Alphaproteobacteria bacterium]